MKAAEIAKKKDADLHKKLVELREKLRAQSFDASGSAKGSSRSAIKKDIARIMTELTKRASEVTNK